MAGVGLALAALALPMGLAFAQVTVEEVPPEGPRRPEPLDPAVEGRRVAKVVEMTDSLEFVPNVIEVEEGDIVEWRNTSSVVHSVTGDPGLATYPDNVELPQGGDVFSSGNVPPGVRFQYAFEAPGIYQYTCVPHELQGMQGRVIVRESASEAGAERGR